MARRESAKQSIHDQAVRAAKDIYNKKGKYAIINPGSEKNANWNGEYIDVIAKESKGSDRAWVIEVETADSIIDTEAKNQWADYNKAYREAWYLAVPKNYKNESQKLVSKFNLDTCNIITWERNSNGTYTYYNLPG